MKILYALLCLFPLTQTTAHADTEGCLESDSVLYSEVDSGPGPCMVSRMPELAQQWLTYPYLGTRSYLVQYWQPASIVIPHRVKRTYMIVITNRCTHQTLSTTYDTKVEDEQSQEFPFEIENPNLDPKISDVKYLAPLSIDAMNAQLKQYLSTCGGN